MPKRLPPQFATPAASPGVLLWQAVNRWQRGQRRALRDAGLSHLQVMLLASVTSLAEQDEPVTQVMLARHARIDAMTTSQVLRTLERKKLVRRTDHPTDSRAYALRPTAAGRRLARQLIHSRRTRGSGVLFRVGRRRDQVFGDAQGAHRRSNCVQSVRPYDIRVSPLPSDPRPRKSRNPRTSPVLLPA